MFYAQSPGTVISGRFWRAEPRPKKMGFVKTTPYSFTALLSYFCQFRCCFTTVRFSVISTRETARCNLKTAALWRLLQAVVQDEVSVVQKFFLQFSSCSLLLFSCTASIYVFTVRYVCMFACMFESERYGGHNDVPTSLIPHNPPPPPPPPPLVEQTVWMACHAFLNFARRAEKTFIVERGKLW